MYLEPRGRGYVGFLWAFLGSLADSLGVLERLWGQVIEVFRVPAGTRLFGLAPNLHVQAVGAFAVRWLIDPCVRGWFVLPAV